MNNEISTIVKTSPLTIVKLDKPVDRQVFAPYKDDTTNKLSNAQPTDQQSTPLNSLLNQNPKDTETSQSTTEQLKKAVDEGNNLLQAVKRNLQFQVDEDTQKLVVKIIDSENGEVVRQIPSEEMLAFIKRLKEMEGQQGSMFQEQA